MGELFKHKVSYFEVEYLESAPPAPVKEGYKALVEYWKGFFNESLFSPTQESMVVMGLNAMAQPINQSLIAIGNGGQVSFDFSTLFRPIIMMPGLQSFIIAHNHPGGDVTPSEPDLKAFEVIMKWSSQIGIQCLDSVVLAFHAGEVKVSSIRLEYETKMEAMKGNLTGLIKEKLEAKPEKPEPKPEPRIISAPTIIDPKLAADLEALLNS
jgi:DNA repair protein RadC